MTIEGGAPPDARQEALPATPRVRSRRRGEAWIVATSLALGLVLVLGVGGAGGWLIWQEHQRLLASRILSPEQNAAVAGAFAAAGEQIAATEQRAADYTAAKRAWDDEHAQVEAWRSGADAPTPALANPGGTAMPGDDPTGRGFLDSIGATGVQVAFDAGPDNCGYNLGERSGFVIVVGGCYDTRFPGWLFLAWDPGTESSVWPVFVHEAMHWYQYQNYYPAFLAASRVGVTDEQYVTQLEADASCRAVYVYGIPAAEYEQTSSPCDVPGWYDGWLLDHLASLGVPVTEPAIADYEVSEVVRP